MAAQQRKTWAQKVLSPAQPEVSIMDKPFAGSPAGSKMLIPTPVEIRGYIQAIPRGQTRTMQAMRADLAAKHQADMTCSLTSGIFVRIVSEAALDELSAGKTVEEITPFWRVVDPKSPVAKKLPCGPEFVTRMREAEAS